MVFGLIVILLLVVFFGTFIGFNLSNQCTIWFFKAYENVPVVILVFISLAAGILLSLLCVLIVNIRSSSAKAKKEPKAPKTPKQPKQAKEPKEKLAKINKKKSLLKKAEKIEKEAAAPDSSSDATIVAESLKSK